MKKILSYGLIFVVTLLLLGVVIYGMKLFNTATTPLIIHNPAEGVQCASMTTSDGVAIDCWLLPRHD